MESVKLIGLGLITICPILVYIFKFKTRKVYEFGQEIVPLDIDVDDIKSGRFIDRKYMPFRYPLTQTMALVKLDMNHWSIVDEEYYHFMSEKKRLFDNYEEEKLASNPFYKRLYGSEYDHICEELCEFVVTHFTTRFPKLFQRVGNVVYNKLLNEEYDLNKMDPFLVVTKLSMEDFFITVKDEDMKQHKCVGVSVAFGGGGFPIVPIVGQGMDEIHKKVPYYESKLRTSMSKWFDKFIDPVERSSWHIVWDKDLNCNELYTKHREYHDDSEKYKEYVDNIPFSDFYVRVERQSLIKLPKSKAIIFSNHPLFLNIEKDLLDVPVIPTIIHRTMHETPKDIIKHKHFDLLRHHLDPYLLEAEKRQQEMGVMDPYKPVRTQEGFPFRK